MVFGQVGELNYVIGQNGMYFIRHGFDVTYDYTVDPYKHVVWVRWGREKFDFLRVW